MARKKSYRTCPKCKSRATKLISLTGPKHEAIECQICGHKYPFPEQSEQ